VDCVCGGAYLVGCWGVVQSVGHLTVNEDGGGSNPPAPANFPSRIAAKWASADLIPILIPVNFRRFPATKYLSEKGEIMGRRAEVVLYSTYTVDGRHRYVRIVRSEVDPVGHQRFSQQGSRGPITFVTIRYKKNERRTFERYPQEAVEKKADPKPVPRQYVALGRTSAAFQTQTTWTPWSFSAVETTNRDRRTGYTAENPRIRKPHKMDTWPNPCHRWRSDSFLCISSSSPCVRTSCWLGLCYTPALRISYKT
jgi:hypothetical protein